MADGSVKMCGDEAVDGANEGQVASYCASKATREK